MIAHVGNFPQPPANKPQILSALFKSLSDEIDNDKTSAYTVSLKTVIYALSNYTIKMTQNRSIYWLIKIIAI